MCRNRHRKATVWNYCLRFIYVFICCFYLGHTPTYIWNLIGGQPDSLTHRTFIDGPPPRLPKPPWNSCGPLVINFSDKARQLRAGPQAQSLGGTGANCHLALGLSSQHSAILSPVPVRTSSRTVEELTCPDSPPPRALERGPSEGSLESSARVSRRGCSSCSRSQKTRLLGHHAEEHKSEDHIRGDPGGHGVHVHSRGDGPLGRVEPRGGENQHYMWSGSFWAVEALQEAHLHRGGGGRGERVWTHQPSRRWVHHRNAHYDH